MVEATSDVGEVVITGMGAVCPIGVGTHGVRAALAEGRGGVGPLTQPGTETFPVRFGGEIRDFDAKQYVTPRKSLKVMCREIQIAFAAAEMATEAAGVPRGSVDPDRLGVIFGSEVFYCEVEELAETYRGCLVDGKFDFSRWGEAMNRIYPLSMLKYLPNMPACQIGIAHDARGPNNSITLGDVSGLLAVIEAASVIRRGLADVMIAGGTGSRINLVRMVNYGDGDLSHRGDNPAGACRPFDAARDGVVNGEGAAAFVLESARHAQRRGATVLATIAGYASGFQSKADGKPGGAIGRSITTALEAAELSPAMVGHVNADGRSTVTEDEIEARAIAATLGDVPVFAPKSYFGHLGSGTGAVELLTSVLAIQSGEIPPTLNYETPDPRCPVQVTCGRPQEARQSTAVVLNQACTGQAVAVVITGP